MEDRGGHRRLHKHIKKEEGITLSLIMFERPLRPRSLNLCNELEAKSIELVLYWQRDMFIVLIICAVFHGVTSMNNSQTLLLRFKNNIRSVFTRAMPEDMET